MEDLDVVAFIKIELRSNGAMSISGNIGDEKLAISMIDGARDAVKNQHKQKDKIIIPSRDVVAPQDPAFPTLPLGDMPEKDWGDR